MVKNEVSILNRLVLSTDWQGQIFKFYWRTQWRQLKVNVNGKSITINTWFVRKNKPLTVQFDELNMSIEFKKLASKKIALIVLKVGGVILKVQAIALRTGAKISMSSIHYSQLAK